ncbi:MAG: alpha/beta fold hydrolase [Pseudomonadota bacterium]
MSVLETSLVELPHGITLSCRTAGEPGRPVLMFLHGFPEAAFVWDKLLTHFAKAENGGYRCIAPNLRGFELSSAPLEPKAYRPKYLVQDIAALIASEGPQLECLIAHDWGGAVAWNIAASHPALMKKLAIINSPHPGTFLRELQHPSAQQAASAYMNFLIRPDAEALLEADDYRRLWQFFTGMGAADGNNPWLTDAMRQHYRAIWQRGLTGPLNYYRASPLRPAHGKDPGATAVTIPREMLEVTLPTLVLWAMNDSALLPSLVDGLEGFVPQMQLHRIADATHWIVHEQPALVAQYLTQFLA